MNQYKAKRDSIAALVFMAFSAFFYLYAIPTQITLQRLWGGSNTGVNSRTFPYFTVSIIFLASLAQFVTSIIKYVDLVKKNGKEKGVDINWAGELRSILVFACCVLYMFLFTAIGYLAATAIVSSLVLIVLRDFKWKHYLSVYIVGGLMFLIFEFLLKINLP